MNALHQPLLELSVLCPLVGAALVARMRDSYRARHWAVVFAAAALLAAFGSWLTCPQPGALSEPGWSFASLVGATPRLQVDALSAPLLPLVALLYALTILATLKTKARRFSFSWALLTEGIRLAMFASTGAWSIILLLAVAAVPPLLELRSRGKSPRVFVLHQALFIGLLLLGQAFVEAGGAAGPHGWRAALPLLAAILVGSGMVPFHCWMTDLFEKAAFGTAMTFVAPLAGAYAAVRLVYPVAPAWMLHAVGLVSLVTVVYAAGMTLVQSDARRFFCYLFLSHSALVFVGLETLDPIGLTGALLVWISVALSLTGLGLTLRALESRFGRLSLTRYHGLYDHTPALAVCFALAGLASVGFPGTLGFVGSEMLLDGAVKAYPSIGVVVIGAAAVNGIAILRAWFWLFTGTRHVSTVWLGVGRRERLAVLTLAALILGGGLYPQPGVASRFEAAGRMLTERRDRLGGDERAQRGPLPQQEPQQERRVEFSPHVTKSRVE